ncbi:MAG: TIGR00296 family protein [Thermoplasmata archaeon]|nr:MAG: TIGR00296 family protein [Thermoplasmata archaeon]HEC89602.1 TIGR00296 family protein [Thermoplasmatales archaeon]
MNLEEGEKAVKFARKVIEAYVKQDPIPKEDLGSIFREKQGVFVTIHTYPSHMLRGCIGIPEPIMPLQDALVEAATSATRDPRFPPLSEKELDDIIVEVTILTPPKLLDVVDPKEYLSKIKIGRDGLIIRKGSYSGLLLPQVPVEENWDVEEFLANTCMKAWLPPDAWLDRDAKLYTFSGQIFTEIEPRGRIEEKPLHG